VFVYKYYDETDHRCPPNEKKRLQKCKELCLLIETCEWLWHDSDVRSCHGYRRCAALEKGGMKKSGSGSLWRLKTPDMHKLPPVPHECEQEQPPKEAPPVTDEDDHDAEVSECMKRLDRESGAGGSWDEEKDDRGRAEDAKCRHILNKKPSKGKNNTNNTSCCSGEGGNSSLEEGSCSFAECGDSSQDVEQAAERKAAESKAAAFAGGLEGRRNLRLTHSADSSHDR